MDNTYHLKISLCLLLCFTLMSCTITGAPIELYIDNSNSYNQPLCPYGISAQATMIKNGRVLSLMNIANTSKPLRTRNIYPTNTLVHLITWCHKESIEDRKHYIEVTLKTMPSTLFDYTQRINIYPPSQPPSACPFYIDEVISFSGDYPCIF